MRPENAARAIALLSVAAANLRAAANEWGVGNYRNVAEKIEQFIAEVAREAILDRCDD